MHFNRLSARVISALAFIAFAGVARADVKVPALFSDHMVLQQGIDAPVWGTAAADEEVTVSMADQKATAKADAAGKWMVRLKPLKVGEPVELTIEGKNKIVIKDVLAGEVWIASGQSNMEFSARSSNMTPEEKAAADLPKLRMFTVHKAKLTAPTTDLIGTWVVCTPQTVDGFSAVGFYFGRDLHKALGVPVGIIHTSWGGTPAQAWTNRATLESTPGLEGYAKAEIGQGREAKSANDPTSLYNGMIAPLVPYGIKGAIWYQGESNAGNPTEYRTLLPAMIAGWRKAWGQGDFPFGIVQLANFQAVKPEPGESNWAALREAQAMTAAQPHNGLAVIIDIGDTNDIHPKNKRDVGKRLGLWALASVYGKDIPFSGPLYESHEVKGSAISVKFKYVEGGLEAKGGEPLKGFAIAGQDGKWVWADAKIEGDRVVVSSAKIEKPVAVRYAWADNPVCTLYNKAGLPAVPFRTDKP